MVRIPVTSEAANAKMESVLDAFNCGSVERLALKDSLLKLKALKMRGLSLTPKDRKAAILLNIYQIFDK